MHAYITWVLVKKVGFKAQYHRDKEDRHKMTKIKDAGIGHSSKQDQRNDAVPAFTELFPVTEGSSIVCHAATERRDR